MKCFHFDRPPRNRLAEDISFGIVRPNEPSPPAEQTHLVVIQTAAAPKILTFGEALLLDLFFIVKIAVGGVAAITMAHALGLLRSF